MAAPVPGDGYFLRDSMTRSFTLAALALCTATFAAPAAAQTTSGGDFTWSKSMPSGASLSIADFNGRIEVHQATGDRAEVRAAYREGESGDSRVSIMVDTSGSDVTICTVYRRDVDEGARHPCRDNDHSSSGRTPRIDFTVLIPATLRVHVATGNGDVAIDRAGAAVSAATGNGDVTIGQTTGTVTAATGNGDVRVDQAGGPVKVSTGNGRIHVATSSGPVSASTGNGPIDVTMKQLQDGGDMSFTSGSGSVTITLPAEYNGEVDMVSGSGSLHSDFPIKVTGRLNPQHIRGTIGNGGPLLRLVTGSGSIELRKF